MFKRKIINDHSSSLDDVINRLEGVVSKLESLSSSIEDIVEIPIKEKNGKQYNTD